MNGNKNGNLLLTRRLGETVCFGDDITVTVAGIKGNQVRLACSAPKNIAIHRLEIYERIQREQSVQGGGEHAS